MIFAKKGNIAICSNKNTEINKTATQAKSILTDALELVSILIQSHIKGTINRRSENINKHSTSHEALPNKAEKQPMVYEKQYALKKAIGNSKNLAEVKRMTQAAIKGNATAKKPPTIDTWACSAMRITERTTGEELAAHRTPRKSPAHQKSARAKTEKPE